MLEALVTAFVIAAALVSFFLRNWAITRWQSRDRTDGDDER